MAIELNRVGPTIKSEDIEKLRELCRHDVPTDYVEFLKATNGGAVESRQYVAVSVADIAAVDHLAGLGVGAVRNTFTWFENMNLGEEKVPPGYLPVAFDPGDRPFVISLVDAVPGVYYWDIELFFEESEVNAYAYFVAPTFSAFLNLLRSTRAEAEVDRAAFNPPAQPVKLVKFG